MQRRKFILDTACAALAIHPLLKMRGKLSADMVVSDNFTGPREPIFIYNNWSAYDELSDNVAQTEALAMRELDEIIRLKKSGMQIGCYVMDAFWFDKDGGYRTWHKTHWPNGPGKWLAACSENNLKPGMWFSTNLVRMGGKQALSVIPEWQDSLATDPNILCLFEGGYLNHLAQTLQLWYDKGIRLFKFDFAYFEAATKSAKEKYTPAEINEKNKTAFIQMLQGFRSHNPGVIITAYNGFGGEMENTFTEFKKTIDQRWLQVFDSIYCGDPRFSDVPMMNIWRSQDNYSDHKAREYEFNDLPVNRIDNCAFMIGKTGTCYYRGLQGWKGMLILELARGGWINVYHGNLELLTGEDARWFAKVQSLYHGLQQQNHISSFGAIPGKGAPYGFKATGEKGEVFAVVNPSQEIMKVELPANGNIAKVLYTDGGYKPVIKGNSIMLGAEQLAVVGFGGYADDRYNLGTDDTTKIPQSITNTGAIFSETAKNQIEAILQPVTGKHIRILLQQFDSTGLPHRSWGGAPPDGKKMDEFIKIEATQQGKPVRIKIEYDKMIWSGLSWAAGEIAAKDIDNQTPLVITGKSAEADKMELRAHVYAVSYE